MPSGAAGSAGGDKVAYEYTKSTGAHGVHAHGMFDVMLGSEREVWRGSDGSGLIVESRGPVAFYTQDGEARWEAAGSPSLAHGPSIALYGPGCLSGLRARRVRLANHPDGLSAALSARGRLTLKTVQELLAEAVAEPQFCRDVYEVARLFPGVEASDEIVDQLGRAGPGLVQIDGVHRTELVFGADLSELLAYQHFLAQPVEWGPVGTLHSWCSYLVRRFAAALPADAPPVPRTPRNPARRDHWFRIRPGFSVTTGHVTDPLAQLGALHNQGVLTDAEYESAKVIQEWAHFDDTTALAWRDLGLRPAEAAELTKLGNHPEELADLWKQTGIPTHEIADWIGAGLTPTEALDQITNGVTREDAAAMRSLRNPEWH